MLQKQQRKLISTSGGTENSNRPLVRALSPDIEVIDKRSKVCQSVIGVACPGDSRVEEKEEKKFKSIVAVLITKIKNL